MVKIRLKRIGAKKAPFYRLVVADSRYPRDGRFLEEIGHYDPNTDPSEIKVDAEKERHTIGGISMAELVEFIAKSLVDQPDQVDVRMVEDDEGITIELRVAPDDMGKVIGKQGRIAKAIRTVVKAAAIKENKKVSVEII